MQLLCSSSNNSIVKKLVTIGDFISAIQHITYYIIQKRNYVKMYYEKLMSFLESKDVKEEYLKQCNIDIELIKFVEMKRGFAIIDAFYFKDKKWHDISDEWKLQCMRP